MSENKPVSTMKYSTYKQLLTCQVANETIGKLVKHVDKNSHSGTKKSKGYGVVCLND